MRNVFGNVPFPFRGIERNSSLVQGFMMKVCKNLLKAAMIRARHAVVVFEAFVTDVDDCQTPMNTPPVDGDEDEIKTEDIYLRTFRPPFDIAKVKTILRKFAVKKVLKKWQLTFPARAVRARRISVYMLMTSSLSQMPSFKHDIFSLLISMLLNRVSTSSWFSLMFRAESILALSVAVIRQVTSSVV